MERLFVYGTLAPGRTNHHVVQPLGGTWQAGYVRGRLIEEGWGASLGFPALIPDDQGERIHGYVLSSDALKAHWGQLDAFEGPGYQRVNIEVALDDNKHVTAQVYKLADIPSDLRNH